MAILRCKEPFAADVKGVPRVLAAGQLVDSSDPVVKGRERLFEPVEEHMAAKAKRAEGVEQTSASPGEKRSVSTPRKVSKRAEAKAEPKADD